MNRKKILALITFLLVSLCTYSKPLKGYIITNENDTIEGVVKVPPVNLFTGNLMLFGLNFDSLHDRVRFKENGQNETVVFSPKDILEVGVTHKRESYVYRSFKVKYRSIAKNDDIYIRRLLRLVYNGNHDLYIEHLQKRKNITANHERAVQLFISYYIAPPTQLPGEEIVCGNTRFKSVMDYLRFLEFDPLFVDALAKKVNFKDIERIVPYYDKWLLTKHPLVNGQEVQ